MEHGAISIHQMINNMPSITVSYEELSAIRAALAAYIKSDISAREAEVSEEIILAIDIYWTTPEEN